MEIKEMTMADIEKRSLEIEQELLSENADIDALAEEVKDLNEKKEEIEAEAEEQKQAVEEVLEQAEEIEQIESEEVRKTMDVKEIRNSKEYLEAYANYIKTGDDRECRTLLSENASGTVAVPELVYDITKTAWLKEGIMSLVRKSFLKGNLKVGFEISGSDAANHTEGGEAVTEETLTLGIVQLTPVSIKKWISISDEVYDLRGEEFLRYIYDELAYRIAKKAADNLVAAIVSCGTASTTTCVGVPVVTAASIAQGTIATALGNLSDDAADPVVVMNKATWSAFKAVQYAGNFDVDPFEGLKVVFNNSLKAFSAASTGDTYAIVGDFGYGALANYPNGDDITFKFDELSKKKEDLIEVLGRQYVAVAPVAPNAFVKINK